MTKAPKESLEEAKRIAARMLAMPPKPHQAKAKPKAAKSPARKKAKPAT